MRGISDGFTSMELLMSGDKMIAAYDGSGRWLWKFGFDIREVDTGQRFGNMEIARIAVVVSPIPIEDSVGGIRVLLDFVYQKTRTDGMEPTRRNENGIAFLRNEGVDEIRHCTVVDRSFEILATGSLFQTDMKFGTGFRIGDEPHFGFGFSFHRLREVGGRMNLDREVIAGVEDLDQEGKAVGFRCVFPKNLLAMAGPQVMQGFSGKFTLCHDGLGVFAIDDFPCLAVKTGGIGKFAMVEGFKLSAAPDAFLVDGFESDGGHAGGEDNGGLESWRVFNMKFSKMDLVFGREMGGFL